MRSNARATLILTLPILLASCSNKGNQYVEKPVSSVDLGGFHLSDDLKNEADHVMTTANTVSFTVCDNSQKPCGPDFAIANENGVSILLWAPRPNWKLDPIGERPTIAKAPKNLPMVALPDRLVAQCCGAGTNWYPMSRLHLGNSRDAQFLTTTAKWPIASCYDTTDISWICGVGFTVRGAFAEVSFGRKHHEYPTQSEIWLLASAVDREIRAVSTPARPQS